MTTYHTHSLTNPSTNLLNISTFDSFRTLGTHIRPTQPIRLRDACHDVPLQNPAKPGRSLLVPVALDPSRSLEIDRVEERQGDGS